MKMHPPPPPRVDPHRTDDAPRGRRLPLVAALAGALAIVAAAFVGGQQTAPTPAPKAYPVSVITVDGQDYNGVVVNGTMLEGVATAAPLMQWENADLRQKNQMTWCLSRLPDEPTKVVARELLTTIYGWYSNLPLWREGCSGTNYFVDDSAQTDCGIGDQAVGCAAYLGPTGLVISFNGNLYRDGRCTILCVRSAMAHELGHGWNLDHTPCDHPEPSNMSGIYLPDGPACAAQGTRDPIREDFTKADAYYGLVSEEPPPPVKTAHVLTQIWQWNEQQDPNNPDDDWQVVTPFETDISVPVTRWVVTIVDGVYGPFVPVEPAEVSPSK